MTLASTAPPWQPAYVTSRARLDDEVSAGRFLPGQWFVAGFLQVLTPVVVMAALTLVVLGGSLPLFPDAAQVYTVAAALVSAAVVWASGQRLAEQHGGWRAAFGFALPEVRDVPLVILWLVVQLVARLSLITILAAATPGIVVSYAGDLPAAEGLSDRGTALLLIGAVLIGPAIEELAFRGVLLRGLMRRMSFWPSALASSALFAALHLAGARQVATVPLLLFTVMGFALLQCLLVRRTGRLGPAMAVHGVLNLLVIGIALGAY